MRFLSEEQTRELSMPEAVHAVETAYRRSSDGSIDAPPRLRIQMGAGFLWVMPALDRATGWSSVKVAFGQRRHLQGGVIGWDPSPGASALAVDAAYLGGLRTGATLAVAIKHLAAEEAESVGLIGTGRLAPYLLEGLRAVRPDLQDLTAYSRDRQQLLAFCDGRGVRPANDAAECFTKDVVILATTSRVPILDDADVPAGTLVCGVGANWRDEREVGDGIVAKMDHLVCDYLPQARIEAADLIEPIEKGLRSWSDVVQLGDVITGVKPGRLDHGDRIFFKSLGIGIEDLAVLQALTARIE